MPWKETNKVDQRIEFVNLSLKEIMTHTELCREFGITRKTGYKWLRRFENGGYPALVDMSRKPRSHAQQLTEEEIITIIKLKQNFPNWGAKKIAKLMERSNKTERIPSISSINRVLDKAGLVKKRRKKRVDTSQQTLRNIIKPEAANDVWTVDFKGWWMGNHRNKLNPLTIRDEKTRYLFDVRLLPNQTGKLVKRTFKSMFKEYGLPKIIRSDNGSPFASNNSILGLTKLSAWWISLGIQPDRIEPGKPYQNGGHERMHKDIAAEIEPFYRYKTPLVQEVLNNWKAEFNNIRPHEALDMKTPAEVYTKSPRKYTGDTDEILYPLGTQSRKVSSRGSIKLNNIEVYFSTALSGYHLGLRETDDNELSVWFGDFFLGKLDLSIYKFYPRTDGA